MQTVVAPPIKVKIESEVQAFAEERGSTAHLPAIVETLKRIFADATSVHVEVHEDPEIADLRWLLFEVDVPWETGEQARAATSEWYDTTAAICPKHLLMEFSLIVRRRP